MPPELKEKAHLHFYTINVSDLLTELGTNTESGLSQKIAEERLVEHGKNSLPEPEKISVISLFLKQLTNFMIYILLGATALSFILGDITDAFLIGIVVVVNTIIGFLQEYKAEKTLASLRKMTSPTAKVLRDGKIAEISSTLLVPGDIVILEEGDLIPADLRLTESIGLHVNESILTGESLPAQKDAELTIQNRVAVGDRLNMVFMGTIIAAGNGHGVVVATGGMTQMGKIAQTLAIPYEKPTPLQKNLNSLGKYLIFGAFGIGILIFIIGFIQGRETVELLFTVVSLAVAVIPEGLIAVVTVTMAVGVQRMAKRNAIVRKLPSVETLGAVNVICSDKTGTLTEGKMTATDFWVGDKLYTVSGTGITPEGSIYCDDKPVTSPNEDETMALLAMALCNDAVLQKSENGTWEAVGDPTEIALQVLAHKLQIKKDELEKKWEFIEGLPFDSDRKRMSVIYKSPTDEVIVFAKGAPEEIVSICSHARVDGKIIEIGQEKEHYLNIYTDMAKRGLRVLALASRTLPNTPNDVEPSSIEQSMIFLGMVGVLDPARPEAKESVALCHQAGIKVMMITGDHPATAANIATELGIFDPNIDSVMSGEEMDKLSEDELAELTPFPKIFARVSPENKLMLINTLRKMNYIVAMTGDGVNDASAIKHANVGIAMGKEGTDVTKQAADIVLADDNFSTIVIAVEEGRRIFTNITKFVRYLLSCNLSAVVAIFAATSTGIPLPFSPVQILWLNLVTDTPPALALGFDESESDAMKNKPRNTKNGLFRRKDLAFIIYHAVVMALIMLSVFFVEFYLNNSSLEKSRTMAFAMLVLVQLTQAFNAKSTASTLFRKDIFANKYLIMGVSFSFLLLLVGIYTPFISSALGQTQLAFGDWLKLFGGIGVFIFFAELFKFLRRRLSK